MSTAALPEVFHRHRCPFCRRLRAYLAEKGVEVALREFHPDRDIELLRAINPKAQVPTWEEEGLGLFDSTIIMQYVEERHPEPALLPDTAKGRACTRLLFDLSDTYFTPSMIGFVRVPPDHPSRPEHNGDIVAHATAIGRLLDPEGPYALGDSFTMADLSLPPLLYRCVEAGFELEAMPERVQVWARAVLTRPSVAALYPNLSAGTRR